MKANSKPPLGVPPPEPSLPGPCSHLFCAAEEKSCVHLAVDDLAGDIARVFGGRPLVKRHLPRDEDAFILVGTLTQPAFRERVEAYGLDFASLEGKWEGYRVQTFGDRHQNLLLCGSDERGTMWAVYDFVEKVLGVDPVGFWTDHEPARLKDWPLREYFAEGAPGPFRYRGWFINDEDLLTEWRHGGGQRYIDYPYYGQVPHPEAMARVLGTAVRLKQNLIIPASFLDIDNPAEENLVRMAVERGLFVTQHHCETLGVSHFSLENYWKARGQEPPSFVGDRERMIETWTYYARKWARYGDQIIWQLGLRGRGDKPVWDIDSNVPDTPSGRGALISEAIACQHRIVTEATGRHDFVSTSTLWDEGTELFKAGHLEFPEGTIIVLADNARARLPGPGHLGRLFAHQWAEDFYEVPRKSGRAYGLYYHVAFWSTGPHLAQGVPPAKIAHAFAEAIHQGDTEYVITNVSNIRENVLGVRLVSLLGCEPAAGDPEAFLHDWCVQQFGPELAPEIRDLYHRLHSAYATEPLEVCRYPALYHDGAITERGKMLLNPDAWTFYDNGELLRMADVLQRATAESLPRWEELVRQIHALAPRIPEERQSFYHHHFAVQAGILRALTFWGHAVAKVLRHGADLPPETQAAELERAAAALQDAMNLCRASETGPWLHWYRGDRKLNLAQLHQLTLARREQPNPKPIERNP